MTKKYLPGIQIRIGQADSLRVQEWIYEIDWQILSKQFEKRKSVLAFDMQPPDGGIFPRFHRLDKLPTERGRFRPHYGDFGGGFEYLFRSHPEGTKLLARSTVLKVYRESLEPFEIVLPNPTQTQALAKGYGIISVNDSRFAKGENYFGFFGDFFKIFHAWEWYSEDTEPFEFRFLPSSVGCFASVFHLESGALLDLTKDVQW